MSTKVRNNPNIPEFFPIYLHPEKRVPAMVPQHNHTGAFEWFFCVAGGGIQVVDQWQCRVSPGELIVIPPGLPHVFCADHTGCDCRVLMVPPEWFDGTGEIMNEAKFFLDFWKKYTGEHGYKAALPAEIVNKHRTALAGKEGIGLCASIFLLLETALQLPDPPLRPDLQNKDTAIQEVLYYINNNFSKKIMVADVLKISGLPRSSFHRRFINVTGITFCRYLNRLRLNAVNWMTSSGISAEEAAIHCGFTSRSNYYQQRRRELDEKNLKSGF